MNSIVLTDMAMVSSKSFCAIAFGRQLLVTLPRKTPRTIGPPGTGLYNSIAIEVSLFIIILLFHMFLLY